MKLVFKHASFDSSQIKHLAVEYTPPRPVPGAGVKFTYTITLADDSIITIDPYDVIEPPGNQDIFYRDKDPSWTLLSQLARVQQRRWFYWYDSESVKKWAQ